MARIAGINLPPQKRVEIGLTYIFGIGNSLSSQILKTAQISPDVKVKDLSEQQVNALREIIEKSHKVEGELKREVLLNIKRLKEINSYRGSRHTKHLPLRGQRTKTNTRTVRGNVRRTMGSGRKPAGQKT
ncbi:MAG: 30S ribosomal protein S13 [Candidatus Buchananbacteria bacterium RIFCSPLOWO2_01_FULL_56_15]|uniref:Small ribosomal subunit protein uS13 n=2 Tax=Candidatus Buchananiibacteriota TaxID=1817903 RepID=A0A1G1YF39_9BACT|nr:MAG: 30S ribosomal protein S13 [Candidatus Buchananbacteria bacterium RIFCSPHIGHO2_02_FULL_56_16]OGY55000.1 MAG: 30S ribosomal protein S13 [Candidatus Buchananbacteria bacterium RIFCSPLOWO2_01_FULL_56_15]